MERRAHNSKCVKNEIKRKTVAISGSLKRHINGAFRVLSHIQAPRKDRKHKTEEWNAGMGRVLRMRHLRNGSKSASKANSHDFAPRDEGPPVARLMGVAPGTCLHASATCRGECEEGRLSQVRGRPYPRPNPQVCEQDAFLAAKASIGDFACRASLGLKGHWGWFSRFRRFVNACTRRV